ATWIATIPRPLPATIVLGPSPPSGYFIYDGQATLVPSGFPLSDRQRSLQGYFRSMFNAEQLAFANALRKDTMVERLGITYIPSPPGTFAATMPVDARTFQPMGLLHGGATA